MNGPGTSWKSIAEDRGPVVMFGGVPIRNTQVTPGGMGEQHDARGLDNARWRESSSAISARCATMRQTARCGMDRAATNSDTA